MDALERMGRDVEYYALDLSLPELDRTLSQVPSETYKHVKCFGLHGTYDDGLAWIKSTTAPVAPKYILSLGSSLGNFTRHEAAGFLRQFAQVLQHHDRIIIGLDACKDKKKVFQAYNDKAGLTHKFILNGLAHANKILEKHVFKEEEWRVVGEYDETAGRHQAFYSPVKKFLFDDIMLDAGERIRVEESYKYLAADRSRLWKLAGLAEEAEWGNSSGEYRKCQSLLPS